MLDASLRAEILDLMMGMRTSMTAFVFITHDLAVAYQVSDRVAVMRDGLVVERGPTGQVIAEPQHSYTKMLIAASEGRTSRGGTDMRRLIFFTSADPGGPGRSVEGLPLRRRGRQAELEAEVRLAQEGGEAPFLVSL